MCCTLCIGYVQALVVLVWKFAGVCGRGFASLSEMSSRTVGTIDNCDLSPHRYEAKVTRNDMICVIYTVSGNIAVL